MTIAGARENMGLPDSPCSPRHCGARFLRQQEAGASLLRAAGTPISRSVHRNAETSGVGVAVAQPLSPELVLVCPELRERALTQLPPIDPDALFQVERRPVVRAVAGSPLLIAEPPRVGLRPRPPLPVAVAAYATEALLFGAVRGAALVTAVGVAAYVLAR